MNWVKCYCAIFVIVSSVTLMLLNGATNEYDKRIEDEEQMKWIEEWKKRK